MFGLLADVNLSLPDATSPWFFWAITFGFSVVSFLGCFWGAIVASKKSDIGADFDGYVVTSVITGIIGAGTLICSAVIFMRIFDSVLPAVGCGT